MHRALLQPRVNLACQLVALDLFFADGEQSDAGAFAAKCRAVVDLSPSPRTGPGARVFESRLRRRRAARKRRPWRSEKARPAPRDPPTPAFRAKTCHGHHRARISRADHPVGLRLAHQARRHVDRAVLLPPEGLRGMIIHGDHFARGHDLDRQTWRCMPRQLRADHSRLSHEQNSHAKLPHGQHTAFDPRGVARGLRPWRQRRW